MKETPTQRQTTTNSTPSDPAHDTNTRRSFLQRTAGAVGGLGVLGIGAVGTGESAPAEFEIPLRYGQQVEQVPEAGSGQVDISTRSNEIELEGTITAINRSAYISGRLYGEFTPPGTGEFRVKAHYHREGDVGGFFDFGSSSVEVSGFAREHGGGTAGVPIETITRDVSGTVEKVSSDLLTLRDNATYDIGVVCGTQVNPTGAELIESVDFHDGDRGFEFQQVRLGYR